MNHTDVIILGAGASGLLCAALCAARGRSTLVLDHAERPAAKVRVSGGGRCNLTNLAASPSDYVGQNPHFVKSALARFTPADILAIVHAGGLTTAEEDQGKIFCRQGASAVADLLVANARAAGAAIRTRTAIHEVRHESDAGRFTLETSTGLLACSRLIVATGGLSWPRLGASDLGHRIARQYGIPVVATRPGLVPLLAPAGLSPFCHSLAGTALPVAITGPDPMPPIHGDLLFTHKGISGPAVLDASLHWSPSQTLAIDLSPGRDLTTIPDHHPRLDVKNALARFVPSRLAAALCDLHTLAGPVAATPRKRLLSVLASLHAFPFAPAGTEGYAKAEVTLGGVDTAHISSKTMQARALPALCFIGETLDVTGRLGGLNLHWAFASAHAAAQAA
ncbi:NAD(P)/FAD-dependent oxidoreductase [Desulfolutivibrio sulfoxidireducens]|uniref:NAD(P)/FAD-dependent oxidoreductase n=1 Tax=Desulfolutivibrio sulfoxidireducens TaxID=2773299 RepID=UPI00159DD84D|nr:aminoacetone oxidase family FAD-binding enzyme [Desulfolutivibrio sulfoxidireducens]QLA19047.1 aminoacetone oxidase family FAD-binding enzyme [Desulfolutivibrio sulfoxidireducens]